MFNFFEFFPYSNWNLQSSRWDQTKIFIPHDSSILSKQLSLEGLIFLFCAIFLIASQSGHVLDFFFFNYWYFAKSMRWHGFLLFHGFIRSMDTIWWIFYFFCNVYFIIYSSTKIMTFWDFRTFGQRFVDT